VRVETNYDGSGQTQYKRQAEMMGLLFALSGEGIDLDESRRVIDDLVNALYKVETNYVNEPYQTVEIEHAEADGEIEERVTAVTHDCWVLYVYVREGDFNALIEARLDEVPEEDSEFSRLRMESFRQTMGLEQYMGNPLSPNNDIDWRDFITSPTGCRILEGELDLHQGLDLGIPVGTPIYAAGDGVASSTGYDDTAGNYIEISIKDMDKGTVSATYMHLDSIAVSAGDAIAEGQYIGSSGNTGRSTGPHLHIQAMKDGMALNALFLMKFPQ
jgi:murein DD-endopeptidase MepM/ murein hydrolase activator NlpD